MPILTTNGIPNRIPLAKPTTGIYMKSGLFGFLSVYFLDLSLCPINGGLPSPQGKGQLFLVCLGVLEPAKASDPSKVFSVQGLSRGNPLGTGHPGVYPGFLCLGRGQASLFALGLLLPLLEGICSYSLALFRWGGVYSLGYSCWHTWNLQNCLQVVN